MRHHLLFATVAAVAGASSASANLLGDPGFEATALSGQQLATYYAGQSFGGAWTVAGGQVTVVPTTYTEGSGPPIVFNAHGGNNWLDLTGLGNAGPTDGIYQDIATTAGRRYDLSFYVGNADTDGNEATFYADPSTVNLSINGGAYTPFINADITENRDNWKFFATSFIASGPSTRIAFFNGTPLTDDANGVDDVSLTGGIPEPASWVLLVTGFGAVGLIGRRRQRTVAA